MSITDANGNEVVIRCKLCWLYFQDPYGTLHGDEDLDEAHDKAAPPSPVATYDRPGRDAYRGWG
jgi:hypothetical protein